MLLWDLRAQWYESHFDEHTKIHLAVTKQWQHFQFPYNNISNETTTKLAENQIQHTPKTTFWATPCNGFWTNRICSKHFVAIAVHTIREQYPCATSRYDAYEGSTSTQHQITAFEFFTWAKYIKAGETPNVYQKSKNPEVQFKFPSPEELQINYAIWNSSMVQMQTNLLDQKQRQHFQISFAKKTTKKNEIQATRFILLSQSILGNVITTALYNTIKVYNTKNYFQTTNIN